jgi:hypothetical protein
VKLVALVTLATRGPRWGPRGLSETKALKRPPWAKSFAGGNASIARVVSNTILKSCQHVILVIARMPIILIDRRPDFFHGRRERLFEELNSVLAFSIRRGLAKALIGIRDGLKGRFQNPRSKSFEDYCKTKWNLTQAHAWRLIERRPLRLWRL